MLFREEALAYYARGPEDGSVLRLDSRWGSIAYFLICAAFAVAFTIAVVTPVHRYAAGPAVLRAAGRVEVTISEGGTISAILVRPGQQVQKGQALIELDSQVQRHELEHAELQIELLQERLLRSPGDATARTALPALRAQHELAAARLLARRVVAPRAGRILDVHLRIGQHLQSGEIVASLSDPEAFTVVGLLPGHARPAVHPGSRLRIELEGYRYHYLELPIQSVASEVIGPEAARRALGLQVADSLTLSGPLALVEARLPRGGFQYDGMTFNFFDGMRATAEVRTRTERAILLFVPGLREVIRRVQRR